MKYVIGTLGASGLVITLGAIGGIETGGELFSGLAFAAVGVLMMAASAFLFSTMMPEEIDKDERRYR